MNPHGLNGGPHGLMMSLSPLGSMARERRKRFAQEPLSARFLGMARSVFCLFFFFFLFLFSVTQKGGKTKPNETSLCFRLYRTAGVSFGRENFFGAGVSRV